MYVCLNKNDNINKKINVMCKFKELTVLQQQLDFGIVSVIVEC